VVIFVFCGFEYSYYASSIGGNPNLLLTIGSVPVYGGAFGLFRLFTELFMNFSKGLAEAADKLPNCAVTLFPKFDN
jgi:hypothetical protein